MKLSDWLESFKNKGVNIFYSSDYLTSDLLNSVVDLEVDDIVALQSRLLGFSLDLVKVDENIFVIKPLQQLKVAKTGLIIQVRDAKQNRKLKKIEARLYQGDLKQFTDGFITYYELDDKTPYVIVSSSGYYPKKIKLTLKEGDYSSIQVELDEKPISIDKIVVTASRYNLATPHSGQTSIVREDIENSVSINNDPLRAVSDLAGNSSTGLSGKYRTRGGHENESMILFDDYTLRNPYHFNHFFSLFSSINQSVVNGMDFYSGVFPVQFGGRLSSVLSAQSGNNINKPNHEIGVDFVNAYYTYRSSNKNYSRQSLVSIRKGLSLVDEKIVDEAYLNPNIQDVYIKFNQDINPNWQASQHLLYSKDKIGFEVKDSELIENIERADSKHQDLNLWTQWNYENENQTSNIQLYYNHSSKSRTGRLLNEQSNAFVDEDTKGSYFGVKYRQTNSFEDKLSMSFGIDLFREETTIQSNRNIIKTGQLVEQLGLTEDYSRNFDFQNQGFGSTLFLNARYRLTSRLVFDLGINYEHKQWISDDVKSPRLNLSYYYNDSTVFRIGLGRHQQSQYIDELYLEDEEPEYNDLTSANVAVFELNKTFDNDINLRVEFYKKNYSETQPYYENLFSGLHILPDLYFDRVKVTPEDSYAAGAEFTLRGQYKKIKWLANYTFSDVEDETDDAYHSRSWDQHHAMKFSVHMPIKSWFLNVSSNYHTGWPKTEILATEAGYQIGLINETTFKGHVELDVKVSKQFKIYKSLAKLSFQVNNLTNSFNTCCVDYTLEDDVLKRDEKQWQPITPSISFQYQWD
jgi:hypothetical protein